MNIIFDEKNRVFKLDTDNSSYMIAITDDDGFVSHLYYGPTVDDTDITYRLRTNEYPFLPSHNNRDRAGFLDKLPVEFPGNGVGDFRESAIEVRDKNGHSATMFYYDSHRIYNGKPALEGLPATFAKDDEAMTLEITVKDKVLELEATLVYTVFKDSDAITRSVKIKNNSQDKIHLTKIMSMSLDMEDEGYKMLTLNGSWGRERRIENREIGFGKQSAGSVRGESSHQQNPFIALTGKNLTQEYGEVYGFNFVYSGNFLAQVEKSQFEALRVSVGINPKDFDFVLESGDIFQAPEVVMVYSSKGLGQMTRCYHDLYRNHLIRSKYLHEKRPVLINNWEATYFDFDTEKLLSIAREAKKAGIEMLVMDDGWFGKRNDDNSSLGDWFVNEDKLKGGLKHLVDEVNKIGLKFGIWFEPEMVCPDSDLYRAHPDWAIAVPDREPCRSRNQYVLDIGRKEVRDHVYECVAKVLREANIAYVKWDMNRQLTDLGSACLGAENQGELLHRYVLGVYELQERLITEFPELLLENCSGGGARFDPGMLYYSPQIWCSDDADAVERLAIQEGTSLVYPLSTMGAHVADCPNHTVGRTTPFETRGHVALAGTFGYELDVTRISQEERDMIPEQVAMYHRYNDLVREGDLYRIASFRENNIFDCYEVVSKDKKEALVTYVQVMNRPNYPSRNVKIPGLAPEKQYKVEGMEGIYYGRTLKNVGIQIESLGCDFRSKLIYIECVDV